MTPLAAMQTATLNAADLMGWTRQGGIARRRASGPTSSRSRATRSRMSRILQHVPFVMKAGVVYKDETKALPGGKLVATAPANTETNRMEKSF